MTLFLWYLSYFPINSSKLRDAYRQCVTSIESLSFIDFMIGNLTLTGIKLWPIVSEIYKTTILAVVLYGYETWFFTLKEERRLKVFENRILRQIFGPKKVGNGEWRRLYNEELHSLYS